MGLVILILMIGEDRRMVVPQLTKTVAREDLFNLAIHSPTERT